MREKSTHFSCAVIGDWHLAFVQAACLAKLGHHIVLVNPGIYSEKPWGEFPKPPVTEPGLEDLIAEVREQGLLDYRNTLESDWTADRIWIAIDTPVNERDEVDLAPLEQIAARLVKLKKSDGPFVVTSQVPIGFCLGLEKRLGVRAAYIPENLRLGKGIETFLSAERTIIGATTENIRHQIKDFLSQMKTEFVLCDLPTSEMVKHATNAFLATSISFANELARLGEKLGVDNQKVAQALKLDKRIGKLAYVAPGLGFAGGTLPRDLRILQKLGTDHHLPTALMDAVLSVNEATAQALAQAVMDHLGSLKNKKILIVGYTYKAETDTLRRSYSIEMAKTLKDHGATILGFDPPMNYRDLSSLAGIIAHIEDESSLESDYDAILLMTPRKQFLNLNWSKLAAHHPLLLDAHQFLPQTQMVQHGFNYKALWQPVIRAKT